MTGIVRTPKVRLGAIALTLNLVAPVFVIAQTPPAFQEIMR